KYGADALRFAPITGNSPGNDTRYIPSRVEACRNFANKLWNASRFVLMNVGDEFVPLPAAEDLEAEDKWILSSLNGLISEVSENIEKYEIGIAAAKVNDFIWDCYCDWYIEFTKPRMRAGGKSGESAKGVLIHVLKNVLKLLHPFMPFVTEEIYDVIPGNDGLLITSAWPVFDPALDFPAETAATEALMERIRAIRNRRAEMNVPPSKKAHLTVLTADKSLYVSNEAHLEKLASVSGVSFISGVSEIDESKMTVIVSGSDRLYIPTGELVDFAKELERLKASYAKQSAELEKLNARLGNDNFVKRAPAELVASEKARAASIGESLESIASAIAGIEAKL
ncbi:MAG: class I tRNA ligase family protein, partial [Eubacteriales bacterium]